MKPLHLCMEAFGPFAGQEMIDFSHLKEGAFFLIHGNTGAGKTSILDAICYALYGETSGDERSAMDLRCHYADPTQLTRVTFDFQLGADHYRVIREPEQQRPKQRGTGTTTHTPTAQLWRWLPEFQPPSPIGQTWSNQEVYKKIKELTSLEAQQFRQVVMLPQGRFREVLTANSQVRQGILSQLFGTGQWRRVQDRLKEMTSEANKALEAAKGHFYTLAEQEQVTDAAALQAKTLVQEEQLQACKVLAETASEYAHDARGRVEAGRELAAAFKAFEKAELHFKQLQANIPEMERLAQTLAAATRAEKLQDPLRIRNARQKEAQDAQKKAVQAEQVFMAAQNDLLAAQQAKTKAEQGSLLLENYKILHQTLKDQLPKVMQWEQLQAKHLQLKSEITAASQKYNDSLRKRSEIQTDCERTQDDLRKANEAITYLPHLKAERQRLEEAHQRAVEAQKIQRDYKILTVQLEDARKVHIDAKNKAEDADQNSEKRWHTYLNGQAASLAQGLKETEPCPVCGSAQHPHLATFQGHLPTLAQVEEARAYARKQNEISQKTHTTYLELQGKQQTLQAQAEALHSPDAPDALKLAQQQAQTAYDQALKTANTQNVLAEKLNNHLNLRNETDATVQSTEVQRHKRQGEEQNILGKQEILSSEIAETDRKPGALQKSIDKVGQDIATIETALKKAEESLQRQKDRLLTAQTHLDDEKRDATDLIEKAEAEQAIFLETLQMAGFANEVALQRAILSQSQSSIQKESLATHQHDYDLAQDQLASRQEAIKNQQKPDITMLLQEMKTANLAEQQAQTAIGQAQGRLQELKQRSTALAQAERARDEKAANYTEVKRLSDVVNGYKPNQTGIDLERFVLGFLLDQVLANATLRLMRMTHNRFQLQRRKDGDRLHKGLDIEVIDAWSGRERPVQTLSGGEGFQASLALALGLADVAQQQSGGVEISAVFVDEGFGSLDPATLEVAIDTLHLLQEGGRMVGIISHVPELERRIETRLEVKTSPTGSHAVWINKRPEAGVLIGQSEAL